MKLIPIQVKLLKEEYKNNSEERVKLLEGERGRIDNRAVMSHDADYFDSDYHAKMNNIEKRQREILYILNSSILVTDYFYDQVELGTTFCVRFFDSDYSDEEEVFTLVEDKVSTEKSTDGFTCLKSDFASSIYHKKVNELFAYETTNGLLCSGTISRIYTESEHNSKMKSLIKQYKYNK